MSDRLRSLQRVTVLHGQRKRLAEWRLAACDQERSRLEAAQHDLTRFVADDDVTGPLAVLALQQAQRLAKALIANAQLRAQHVAAVQAAERQQKLAERVTETVDAEERAAAERRSLEALIDSLVTRPSA